MKIISIKNPLTEEQTKDIEKYFKETISCKCGTTFETDIRDYKWEYSRATTDSNRVTVKVNCPCCGRVCQREFYYKFGSTDLENLETYRNYLNIKDAINENN